jgi:hypothetical protein
MRIWRAFGSEHSSNYVILGTFSTSEEAYAAHAVLQEFMHQAESEHERGTLPVDGGVAEHPAGLVELMKKHSIWLSAHDPAELLMEYHVEAKRNQVIITTNEYDISAIQKVLLGKGARVEVFSGHHHDSPFGRQTRGERG